ncbi:MAG: hypothetical protein ACK5NB_12200 [Flavobacteriaceae bacterium]
MTTKQQLLQECHARVDKRINDYKEEINLLKEAIADNDKVDSESEDGSGSKLLDDLEKNIAYLNDAQNMKEQLKLVKTNILSDNVVLGSAVKTNIMNFYIAVSSGKIELETETYYAISLSSPIGQLLKNKTAKDSFTFNNNHYVINEII